MYIVCNDYTGFTWRKVRRLKLKHRFSFNDNILNVFFTEVKTNSNMNIHHMIFFFKNGFHILELVVSASAVLK